MKRKLVLNTSMSFMLQIVTIVSGFIVPKLFISTYGSNVNGLVYSITQFLAVISFLEAGVGSVLRYNLYKPLANHDNNMISKIIVSANKFFRKLAIILLGYSMVLMVFYPLLAEQQFSHVYTALLIVSMCISSFAQYYFGQVNQLLLTADQKGYIQYTAQILTIICNTVACVIMIYFDIGIHIVKLVTSLIFLIRPLFLQWYVKRHYNIYYGISYIEEPIKQKWNGLAQHISYVVLEYTDIIVLTFFSTLSNVSIYSVYHMVVVGVKTLITSMTSGIDAYLGNIIACGNKNELSDVFAMTEWVIHTLTIFLFGCTTVLIIPFVLVYTNGITDANYYVPFFALLISLANAGHCLRLPYSIAVLSAGHYKQSQYSYIFAAMLNLIFSILLVTIYGLIGVAIGTLAAMVYQTIWMAWYSYKNILERDKKYFIKQIFVDAMVAILIGLCTQSLQILDFTYTKWALLAFKCTVVCFLVVIGVNAIFYSYQMNMLFVSIKKYVKNSKQNRKA